jgi:hypothetical protein
LRRRSFQVPVDFQIPRNIGLRVWNDKTAGGLGSGRPAALVRGRTDPRSLGPDCRGWTNRKAGTSEVPGAIVEMSLRDKEGLWDDIWRVGAPGRRFFRRSGASPGGLEALLGIRDLAAGRAAPLGP